MKEFEINADGCKGLNLEASSFYLLKTALFQRMLDEREGLSDLVSPTLAAHKETIDFEKKLLELDRRLKRGYELIMADLR